MPAPRAPAKETPRPVTLITGAGSGIGRAIALRLAQAGHDLALAGRRGHALEETASMLPAGATALCLTADVGARLPADRPPAAEIVDRTVGRFGRLDVLVNNAGDAPLMPIEKTTPDVIDRALAVNAFGPAVSIARAWPVFQRQRSGCVINISSMSSIDPFPGFLAYAAGKAACNLLARVAALEGREIGVRAFAIAPGAVETPMLRALFDTAAVPPSRCLDPDDVARLVLECVRGEHDDRAGEVIPVVR